MPKLKLYNDNFRILSLNFTADIRNIQFLLAHSVLAFRCFGNLPLSACFMCKMRKSVKFPRSQSATVRS